MCSRIVEMLGCRELCCIFCRKINAALFHQFNESVHLRRCQKSVNRIAEHNQLGALQGFPRFRKIPLKAPNLLPDI